MSKTLIIAEKPSVATDLARVLGKQPGMGKFKKEKNHYESDSIIITSAVGHLVENQRLTEGHHAAADAMALANAAESLGAPEARAHALRLCHPG